MNHRQRLESCLSGARLDRVPVALWRHFPVDDQDPYTLAKVVLHFQHTYDFDFVKVTPASSYFVKDWGLEDAWEGNPEGTRAYKKRIIKTPEDWTKLPALDPNKGQLAQEIVALKIIVDELGDDTPVIQTIFSPLGQANKMAGQEKLLYHLRHYPEAVKEGLKTISENTIAFIQALKTAGVAGIFYAVQWGQYGILSEQEFREFGKYYDLQVLQPAEDFWLNVLHLHGNNVMFDQVTDYPISVLNWHDQETSPSLSEGKKQFGGAVCGGLRQWQTLAYGDPAIIEAEVRTAITATNGERFILGTGCVTPIIAPHGNLVAVRQSVKKQD